MADHTQPWAERTVDVPPPPADPWAQPPPPFPAPAFQRGVAHVQPVRPRTEPFPVAPHEPTGTGWPGAEEPQARMPVGSQLRQLRRGGGWSTFGVLFAFVCWGIWAISSRGDLTTPVLVFVLTLVVAVGVFALARVVGRLVLERQFRRTRRTARGAHLVTALFLVGFGVACLRQTGWVMEAWRWAVGLF